MSLKSHKQESQSSTGTSSTEKQKLIEIGKQNLLLAERIEQTEKIMMQLAEGITKEKQMMVENQEKTHQLLKQSIKETKEMKEDLADKVEAFVKGADSTLLTRQQEILNSFEKRETERETALEKKMIQVEKNHIKAQTLKEWSSSLLHLFVMVAIAVVLVNALRWGIWNGLGVGFLYEWGSQWLWLQIVMIIVFITGAVFLLVTMYRSVREFFN